MTVQLSSQRASQRFSTHPSQGVTQSVTQTVPISVNINSPTQSVQTKNNEPQHVMDSMNQQAELPENVQDNPYNSLPTNDIKYPSNEIVEINRLNSIIRGFESYANMVRDIIKEKIYVPGDTLCDIIKQFTNSDSVTLDVEGADDVGCLRSSRLRKVNSIFVTQGLTTVNLKYNLPEDYKRIQSLGISLKYVIV